MLPIWETMASGPGLISAFSSTALTESAQPGIGAEEADAVRAEQAHAAARAMSTMRSCVRPAFGAGLGKAVAVDRRDRQPLRDALLDRAGTASAGTMMNAWSIASGIDAASG